MRPISDYSFSDNFCRCFPHVVNLACKAVIEALNRVNYANDILNATNTNTVNNSEPLFSDPISKIRSLIRAVSSFYISLLGSE